MIILFVFDKFKIVLLSEQDKLEDVGPGWQNPRKRAPLQVVI
jgi:hypothetical protein